jgi:carbonic anhydrase
MGKLILGQLLENNRKWIKKQINKDPDYFKKLALGQSPKYLMVGCSDSRVPLNNLLKAPPGEIFIHRNIANQVSLTDMNFLSVLEYSVEYLKIEYIIIVGHYACGGLAAAIDGVDQGLMENWVAPIKDLYINNFKELSKIEDKQKMADKLSEINVVSQARNIFKTAVMHRALLKETYPKVLAWIFDIYTGEMKEMHLPLEQWKEEGILPKHYEY